MASIVRLLELLARGGWSDALVRRWRRIRNIGATSRCPRWSARLDKDAVAGTVNLTGRVTRMQASGSGHWGLLPTHVTDFVPDLKFLGPRSSMLCGSDVIAAEVEEVIDLIVG